MVVDSEKSLDLDDLITELYNYRILPENELESILMRVKMLFLEETNVISLSSPIMLVGDIHGQFPDLLNIFNTHGSPKDRKYLFLGDYVDRGDFSVECITLLFLYKVRYPDSIYIIRGNHESEISYLYGLYDEIIRKYGTNNPWKSLTETFNYLPIATIIDGNKITIHGGLSPLVNTIEDIRQIDRIREIPVEGAFSDLLWSDPSTTTEEFVPSYRGAGYLFGINATRRFLENNKLDLLIRAHQMVKTGFETFHDGLVYSLFSAPNYYSKAKNSGAVLEYTSPNEHEVHYFQLSGIKLGIKFEYFL